MSTATPHLPASACPAFLAGGGQVGAMMRAADWGGTPMGPIENWPQSFRSVISALLNSPMLGAVLWGPDLLFFYNDAYIPSLGERHPVGLGRPVSEVWGAAWDAVAASFHECFATGAGFMTADVELPIVRHGQHVVSYWDFSVAPIRGEDGAVIGLLDQGFETTTRVLADRERAAAARSMDFRLKLADRLRPLEDPDEVMATASQLLGEHLGVARVVYGEVDESGDTIRMGRDWVNGALPSMAGTLLVLDEFGPLIRAEVREGRMLVIDDVTTDERSAAYADSYAANGVRSFVSIPLMKSGRLRAILNLHNPQPWAWSGHEVAVAEDMVERTWAAVESARAQAELRSERDLSQSVFDSMTEGFALLDLDWTVLQVNAMGALISRRARSELLGRSQWDAVPELVGSPVEALYRRVRASGQAENLEHRHVFPDGTQGWIEIRVNPLADGKLAVLFRDVTERKRDEEALRDADRRKDEFLAMLAHELRNPLAPIGAAAELLQIARLDEARMRQTSQIIGRQVRHMTSLIDDLLDVSRVTRGLVELNSVPVDIGQVVTDAIEQVTPLIRTRHHHLALQLAPDTTTVLGDKKRLVQVLTNLLNNAAKYTHEGGHLLLKTERRDRHVCIEVADDGIGMAPALVARAFDLFAQAERTSDRSSGGLGLGLALVKSLVELHHGTVRCDSAGLGRGSTFTVSLPLLAAEDSRGAQPAGAPAQHADSAMRILVVDDNVDAASMLAMLLEVAGHQVLVEHAPHLAIERAREAAPQVCLLDIGLPEMDGNELARRLRAQPETAHTVLIALTGYGQESDRKQTLAAGFDYHLVKPVDTNRLMDILAGIDRH